MKNAPVPGEIDEKPGPNFSRVLAAFAGDRGLRTNDSLTDEVWRELADVSTDPALIGYTIAEADVVHFPRRFRRGWKT
jgi:hypothetical protein